MPLHRQAAHLLCSKLPLCCSEPIHVPRSPAIYNHERSFRMLTAIMPSAITPSFPRRLHSCSLHPLSARQDLDCSQHAQSQSRRGFFWRAGRALVSSRTKQPSDGPYRSRKTACPLGSALFYPTALMFQPEMTPRSAVTCWHISASSKSIHSLEALAAIHLLLPENLFRAQFFPTPAITSSTSRPSHPKSPPRCNPSQAYP